MSGAASYWRRNAVDVALVFMLLAGGLVGTVFGVWLFTLLRSLGHLDLTIGLSYVILLCVVGALMVTGKPARHHPLAAGQAGRAAPAGQPYLVPRSPIQGALQTPA